VFDIGGNKFRLVVIVRFAYGKVFIRHVMFHEEYTSGKGKEGC
jgi:mRNA interferase HigB